MAIVESFMPPYSLRPCLAKQVAQHSSAAGQAGPPEHEPLSSDLSKELMQVRGAGLEGLRAVPCMCGSSAILGAVRGLCV